MKNFIYFIRHAESLSNVDPNFAAPEDTLSEYGNKQAVAVASRFKHAKVEAIYSSTILRAQLTAAALTKTTTIEPETLSFIQEREGSFTTELTFTNSEPFAQLLGRLREAKHFIENNTHKRIIIVSHAIFLKALAAYILLGELFNENTLRSLDDVLVLDNAGISTFVFNTEKRKWRLMQWNDTSHIQSIVTDK